MNEKLQLGAPKIDRQHEELFKSLQRLNAPRETCSVDELINDALSGISQQICTHFAHEEIFMRGLELPERMLKEHCAAHLMILEELTQIHINAMYGQALTPEKLTKTIAHWISQHLIEFDLELKPYIAAIGQED